MTGLINDQWYTELGYLAFREHGKAILNRGGLPYGTMVATRAAGHNLGVAKRANVVMASTLVASPPGLSFSSHHEKQLVNPIVRVLEDITSREAAQPGSQRGKSIVNLSFSAFESQAIFPPPAVLRNVLYKHQTFLRFHASPSLDNVLLT